MKRTILEAHTDARVMQSAVETEGAIPPSGARVRTIVLVPQQAHTAEIAVLMKAQIAKEQEGAEVMVIAKELDIVLMTSVARGLVGALEVPASLFRTLTMQ